MDSNHIPAILISQIVPSEKAFTLLSKEKGET
jgi:hypothetical protein